LKIHEVRIVELVLRWPQAVVEAIQHEEIDELVAPVGRGRCKGYLAGTYVAHFIE
jgi:hypothetical protein